MTKTRIIKTVLLMLTIAVGMALMPSQAEAGRHRRGGGCGCYDACYYTVSVCDTGCYDSGCGCGYSYGGRHHRRGGGYGCGSGCYGYGEWCGGCGVSNGGCGVSYGGGGCDGGYVSGGARQPMGGQEGQPAAPGGEGVRSLPPAPAAPSK